MNTTSCAVDAVVKRARAEYLEMPGLCLAVLHAARLFGVNTHESQCVLSKLAGGGFLRQNPNGVYRRPCPRCS
jgi:hypothetical protein